MCGPVAFVPTPTQNMITSASFFFLRCLVALIPTPTQNMITSACVFFLRMLFFCFETTVYVCNALSLSFLFCCLLSCTTFSQNVTKSSCLFQGVEMCVCLPFFLLIIRIFHVCKSCCVCGVHHHLISAPPCMVSAPLFY